MKVIFGGAFVGFVVAKSLTDGNNQTDTLRGRPTQTKDDTREIFLAGGQGDREHKYSELATLAKLYNRIFDVNQYWAYGCNCMFVGDKSLLSLGPHVDALDRSCQKYKECLRCVAQELGPHCNPDQTTFTFKINSKNRVVPKDEVGSCERALFECGHQYAKESSMAANEFDPAYHLYRGFDPISEPELCRSGPISGAGVESSIFGADFSALGAVGRPSEASPFPQPIRNIGGHQCCGGFEQPYQLYNADYKTCCSDGSVRDFC
jgi:hypothetical protein